tara:strand:- start:4459 stop:5208 length:750 start_codon:yes stop_codon:yes gene_type:complete
MAGPIPREAKGWQLRLNECKIKNLKDFRVAIWNNDDLAPVANEISNRCDSIGEKLINLGATVSFEARPEHDKLKGEINYQLLLQSVMQSGISEEDFKKVTDMAAELKVDDFSVNALLIKGTVLSHRDWLRQNYGREQIKVSWEKFFEDWDILICPQLATTAISHDHRDFSQRMIKVDNQEQRYFQQIFWPGLAVNAHLPSTVFPTGLSEDKMPIGLQAIGAAYEDKKTIKFAELIEKEIGGFSPPSNFD